MTEFQLKLNKLILEDNGFSKLYTKDDNDWADLPIPSQEELNGYELQYSKLTFEFLEHAGYTPIFRPAKKYERVLTKFEKPPKIMPHFKRSSDFSGFKIEVQNINEIFRVMSILMSDIIAKDSNARFFIERNVFDPNEKDIVQRLYFYSTIISQSVVEVWIGHPFALSVFAENSYVRDNPSEKDEYVSWFKDGKYDSIKKIILEQGDWKVAVKELIVNKKRMILI